MKNLKLLFLFFLGLGMFTACSDDDDPVAKDTTKVQMVLKTKPITTDPVIAGAADLKVAATIELEAFLINLSEIEFELYDDDDDDVPDFFGPTEFKGSFLIDLLSPDATEGLTLATGYVPNGLLEEIEFEFDEYKGTKNDDIRGYTVFFKGNFYGVPVTLKSDEELEIEVEFNDHNRRTLNGEDLKLILELNFQTIVDHFLALDISKLIMEEDGSILIDSKVNNGNQQFAKDFMKALEKSFDLDDDDDDDD